MAKVLYVRHGQSQANVDGVFAGGDNDTRLTDEGRLQAKQAAETLKSDIHLIISSPLSRTVETAQIIADEIGYDRTKIKLDSRLKEYSVGEGEGKPFVGLTASDLISFPGAENPELFARRVRAALRDASAERGTVLVVGHGGVSRLIECLRSGKDPKWFYDMPKHHNAVVVELDLGWLEDTTDGQ